MAVLGLTSLLAAPALAEPKRPGAAAAGRPAPGPAEAQAAVQPWAVGITAEQKAEASKLLARGNDLLIQNRYAAALQEYEGAIRFWDHPAIRANMVICYINLGRPLEAYESALLALRYGAAPHEKREVYAATVSYRKQLVSQISGLEVSCTESGATVTLDGQDLMDCPGVSTHHLLPGKHQLVARKSGFLTLTRDFKSDPGKSASIEVQLVRMAETDRQERPWAPWKPWAIAGVGGGLMVAGGLVWLKAESDFDEYDATLERVCPPTGCAPGEIPSSASDLKSRAELENDIAIAAMVTGGAVAATGLIAVLLNRRKTDLSDEADLGVAVAPLVTAGAAGLSLGGSF